MDSAIEYLQRCQEDGKSLNNLIFIPPMGLYRLLFFSKIR